MVVVGRAETHTGEMKRVAHHYHLGLDHSGHRHVRLRGAAEVRRALLRRRLHPEILVVLACRILQPRWRNGLQRRHFLLLTEQVRGDLRCFLMTLRRPPLIPPVRPF